jgi:hypothetical protein
MLQLRFWVVQERSDHTTRKTIGESTGNVESYSTYDANPIQVFYMFARNGNDY